MAAVAGAVAGAESSRGVAEAFCEVETLGFALVEGAVPAVDAGLSDSPYRTKKNAIGNRTSEIFFGIESSFHCVRSELPRDLAWGSRWCVGKPAFASAGALEFGGPAA